MASYEGTKIVYTAIPDDISRNTENISRLTGEVLGESWMHFTSFKDYLAYLSGRNEKIVLVIDEYQDMRGKDEREALIIDAMLRDFIDNNSRSIKLILLGSAVRVLERIITDSQNPLFGMFTAVINLQELNYL